MSKHDRVWWQEDNKVSAKYDSLPIEMRRNWMGAWCGYVGVQEGHPLYGVHYSDEVLAPPSLLEREVSIDDIGAINLLCGAFSNQEGRYSLALLLHVHGGVTFSGLSTHIEEERKHWWFGFDCSHSMDLTPMDIMNPRQESCKAPGAVYRTQDYAFEQCRRLADQLITWQQISNAQYQGVLGSETHS